MATRIFKRQDKHDGRWCSCPVIEGRRRWFYGETEQEVQEKIDEARYLAKRGRIVVGNRQTVEQFLEEWLAGKAPPGVRPSTHAMYGVHIRRALPAIGALRLTKLTTRHLQLCYADLNATHAPRTIHTMHTVIRLALEQAVRWDILVRNPAQGVALPKLPRGDRRTLSREQVRILLDGTAGTRWHAFFALMCATGLRISEQAALLWSDLDQSVPLIDVHQQLARQSGKGMVFTELKTDSSYRKILLPPGVLVALKKHKAIQAAERLEAGAKWEDQALIFPNLVGRPSDPHSIRNGLYGALSELSLPRVTPHQLRHTAATLLLEENRHPSGVQKMLGHARASITLDVYSHVTPRVQRELADTMEGLLFG